MSDLYILDGHEPVVIDDVLAWGRWFEDADRVVAQDHVGVVLVSTVFIGADHNFGQVGPPILFETMIFGGDHDQHTRRYPTWVAAERGHAETLAMVREATP